MRNRCAHRNERGTSRQDGATGPHSAPQGPNAAEPVYAKKRKHRLRDPRQAELALDRPSSEAKQSEAALYLSLGKRCAQNNATGEPTPRTKSVKVITPCKCSSWYCEGCMATKGYRLKRRLREALESVERGVYGITLTIDGTLYRSPYDAWLDVMKRRLIARLVEKLCKLGHVANRSYFWVVEFQKATRQPHWHVLVDAKRIPFGVIVELWSACRPRSAPKLAKKVTAENYKEFERPAFGSVRYSFKTGKASSAANYACKYLIKPPEDGFPDWVLDHEGRVPRYGRSRDMFPSAKKQDADPSTPPKGYRIVHGPDCFCSDCRAGSIDSRIQRRSLKTTRERLQACGSRSILTRADAIEQADGSIKLTNRTFDQMLDVPYAVLQSRLESLGAGKGQIIREVGYDVDLHHISSSYRPDDAGEEEPW